MRLELLKWFRRFLLIVMVLSLALYCVIVIPSWIERPMVAWASNAKAMLKTQIYSDQINYFNKDFKVMDDLPSFRKTVEDKHYSYIVYVSQDKWAISKKDQALGRPEHLGAHFVAYAWPKRWGADGNTLLAITEFGMLYETDQANEPPLGLLEKETPIWNALMDGWGAEVSSKWHRVK